MSEENKVPKYAQPAPVPVKRRVWPGKTITASPEWVSVDLRDGNQALPRPLNPEQKLEYFQMLCRIGFKTIEVAFPSASADDFAFTRRLIEENHIPDDVSIMALTQCREHLIARTFEALQGVKRAVAHLYAAASELHMRQVFGLGEAETIEMVVKSVRQTRALAEAMPKSDIRLEFSPEEFTDSSPDFVLRLCEAVLDAWGKATPKKPVILNLPATVERRPPNQYADLIEDFCRRFSRRKSVKISVHSHNDQGMAVAGSELAVLAGADRVEGTLFGHGERTGNVDLVTFANNLASRGIETGLDFSDLPRIVETVERLTGMPVYYRQPYAGELVFTAFSGSHQDAIRKGVAKKEESARLFGLGWKVPYLHVDPQDLGRSFEGIIRINSQSGKGGVAWVLEQDFGIAPPKAMHPDLGKCVQKLSDRLGRELSAQEVYDAFLAEFVNPEGPYRLIKYWPRPDQDDPTTIHGELRLAVDGVEKSVSGKGNGPLSAFVHCLNTLGLSGFRIDNYDEQAVGKGEDARAMAYVPLKLDDNGIAWGVGTDTNIDQAAVRAIVAGLNRARRGGK